MKRSTEIELAQELLDLHANKSAFVNEEVSSCSVEAYFDSERFTKERDKILRSAPQAVVHSSELPEPGSFLRRDFAGLPAFFTRDRDGDAHAFLNVCRHRGTRLVDEPCGVAQRFSCPYHAWTYNNRGELVGVPHERLGFSEIDRTDFALTRLGSVEQHGWVWVWGSGDQPPVIDDYLAGLAEEFDWFGASDCTILHTDEQVRSANWKILVEGGIEAYHFRVAHRQTIGPYFLDNLSSYRRFGPHLRSIFGKQSLTELAQQPVDDWRLRDHAQILYSIFPTTQLLVQADHVAWLQLDPLTASSTRIRVNTLVPKDRLESEEDLAHWEKNHAITMKTLAEDFAIGESIQAGLESGANERLTFGRFEGALAEFKQSVESRL